MKGIYLNWAIVKHFKTTKMSIINLTAEDRRTLARWMGKKTCHLSLIYSAERDGFSPKAFHAKCNNLHPLVVVASNTAGYVFGGHAPMPWINSSNEIALTAPTSFLFRLKKANEADYMTFAAKDENASVLSMNNYGPCFGDSNTHRALRFIMGGEETVKKAEENFFRCNMYVDINYGFQTNGKSNNALYGGNTNIINIEVYTVEEDLLREEGDEWRKGLVFSDETLTRLKDDVLKFKPPPKLFTPKANILLIGQVGSGKSSFYNTLNSIFQGHMTMKATTGSSAHSVTTKFRQYEFHPGWGDQVLNLRLCDTMGLEDQEGLNTNDLPFIIDGHVQNGFQFNPAVMVTSKHPDYRALPKDKDCIHAVAIVVAATTVTTMSAKLLDKLRQIKIHANERAIPVAVLVTKVDEICENVSRDVSVVFRSAPVKDCIDVIAEKLGVQKNAVLPVKNYNEEMALDRNIDILALHMLRHLTRLAHDYFDDQMEQKGLYGAEDTQTTSEAHNRGGWTQRKII